MYDYDPFLDPLRQVRQAPTPAFEPVGCVILFLVASFLFGILVWQLI